MKRQLDMSAVGRFSNGMLAPCLVIELHSFTFFKEGNFVFTAFKKKKKKTENLAIYSKIVKFDVMFISMDSLGI